MNACAPRHSSSVPNVEHRGCCILTDSALVLLRLPVESAAGAQTIAHAMGVYKCVIGAQPWPTGAERFIR